MTILVKYTGTGTGVLSVKRFPKRGDPEVTEAEVVNGEASISVACDEGDRFKVWAPQADRGSPFPVEHPNPQPID